MESPQFPQAQPQQAEPVSLGTALKRIARRKVVILASVLVFAILGAIVGLASPNIYEAKAVINVTQPSSGANGLRTNSSSSIDMDTEEAIAGSAVVLQTAADSLGMDYSTVKGQVTAAGHSNSTILDIIVNSDSPEKSADIANAVAEAYLKHRSDTIKASREETRQNIDSVSEGIADSLVDQAILTIEAISTDTGTIISRAAAPSSPSNFSWAQAGFVGASLGLLLGLVAAYLLDRANRTLAYSQRLSEISGLPVSVIDPQDPQESLAQLLRRLGAADGNLDRNKVAGLTIYSPTAGAAHTLTTLTTEALTSDKYSIADADAFMALNNGQIEELVTTNAPVIFETPANASLAKVMLTTDFTKVLLLPFTSESTVKGASRLFQELTLDESVTVIPVYFDGPSDQK